MKRQCVVLDVITRAQPDDITYNTLISACKKGTQPERALELFDAMERQGALHCVLMTYEGYLKILNFHFHCNASWNWLPATDWFALKRNIAIFSVYHIAHTVSTVKGDHRNLGASWASGSPKSGLRVSREAPDENGCNS